MIDEDDMSSLNQPAPRTPAASREAFVEQEFYAGRDFKSGDAKATPVTADDVVEFWRQAGPSMWFAKDADFDRRFREAFLGIAHDLRKPQTGSADHAKSKDGDESDAASLHRTSRKFILNHNPV